MSPSRVTGSSLFLDRFVLGVGGGGGVACRFWVEFDADREAHGAGGGVDGGVSLMESDRVLRLEVRTSSPSAVALVSLVAAALLLLLWVLLLLLLLLLLLVLLLL